MDKHGDTPLKYLAASGCRGGANILIEAGADVNAVDNNQRSLLHLAAEKGGKQILALLLDARTDINAYGGNGRVSLHQVMPGDPGEEVSQVNDGTCRNEVADQGPEVELGRKRRHSTGTSSASSSILH